MAYRFEKKKCDVSKKWKNRLRGNMPV